MPPRVSDIPLSQSNFNSISLRIDILNKGDVLDVYVRIRIRTKKDRIRTYARTYVRTYVRTYICTYVRTFVRPYVRTHARTDVQTYKQSTKHPNERPNGLTHLPTYVRTYVRTPLRTYVSPKKSLTTFWRIWINVPGFESFTRVL